MGMERFAFFLITLAVGALGGLLVYKTGLPAGAMLGSILAVAGFGLLTGRATLYPQVRVCAQLLSGALIGSRVTRENLRDLRKVLRPVCILILSIVLFNICCAIAMSDIANLNLATTLFAAAPGGMNDMALLSLEFGANGTVVAFLQLFRILLIYLVMPPVFSRLIPALRNRRSEAPGERRSQAPSPPPRARVSGTPYIRLALCAALGGLLLYFAGVSAGAMIGSMLASCLYCIFSRPVTLDRKLRIGVQIVCGAYIGTQIDIANFRGAADLLRPMGVMAVGVLLFVFITGFVMARVTKLDLATCLMASTPGGLQEMSLLAEELGVDTPKVVILQTVRLMFVVMVAPALIPLLSVWLQ